MERRSSFLGGLGATEIVAILVAAWLMFGGGFATLSATLTKVGTAAQARANATPNIVIFTATAAATSSTPATSPAAATPVRKMPVKEPIRQPIVPQGMPQLPTATPPPTPTPEWVSGGGDKVEPFHPDLNATAAQATVIQEWLNQPPEAPWPTATPFPVEQAPTVVESFQEPSILQGEICHPAYITYLRGSPCYGKAEGEVGD